MSWAKALRKHGATLFLSSLALGTGLYVLIADRGSVTTDEALARKKNLFRGWHTDEIESVTVEGASGSGTLTRTDPDRLGQRGWVITIGKERFPADEQRVDQLLGTLEFATSERIVSPTDVDPSALGFDQPRAVVRITMDGRVSTVEIGSEATSPKGAAHARVTEPNGNTLHVVTAELVAAVSIAPLSLRARDLVPFAMAEIERIEVERGASRFHLVHPEGNSFELRLGGPSALAGLRVARSLADELLTSLSQAEVDTLLEEDVAERASKPGVSVKVISKQDQHVELNLGGECPDKPELVVVKAKGTANLAGCVPKTILDGLDKPDTALVDLSPFFGMLDEVEELSIDTTGSPFELARKGTGFWMRKPKEQEVEGDAGRNFLEPLLALRATQVEPSHDLAQHGLEPPQGRIRFVTLRPSRAEDGGDLDLVEELWIGAPKGDVVPVLRVADKALLTFPLAQARVLWPNKTALRSPVVINAPETAVERIRVLDGDRMQTIRRTEQGGWKLDEPQQQGLAADIGFGTELSTSLCPLRAERFVAEKDDGSFGLQHPRLSIDLELGKGADAKLVRLLLGAPTDRGSFAKLEGDDAVFVLDKRVEASASRWLLDRSPFSFALGDVLKATIAPRDPKSKPIVLEREGGLLRIASEPSATARAASLRDALADLIPEGAVGIGAPRKEQDLDPPRVTLTIEREDLSAPEGTSSKKPDPKRTIVIKLGADDSFRGTAITYARIGDIPATYAIAQGKTRLFVEAAR